MMGSLIISLFNYQFTTNLLLSLFVEIGQHLANSGTELYWHLFPDTVYNLQAFSA